MKVIHYDSQPNCGTQAPGHKLTSTLEAVTCMRCLEALLAAGRIDKSDSRLPRHCKHCGVAADDVECDECVRAIRACPCSHEKIREDAIYEVCKYYCLDFGDTLERLKP